MSRIPLFIGATKPSQGHAAGKKVSEGISAIFGKVDKQASEAAKQGAPKSATPEAKPAARESKPQQAAAPTTEAAVVPAPSSSRRRPAAATEDPDQVPPPPGEKRPVHHVAKKPAETSLLPAFPVALWSEIAAPVLPPPPVATPEALKTIVVGSTRADVLRLGDPSSRISMLDGDHLSETFRYDAHDATFGVIHMSDGVVTSVDVH